MNPLEVQRVLLEVLVRDRGFTLMGNPNTITGFESYLVRAWDLAIAGLTSTEVDLAVQSIHEQMAREEGIERRRV